MSLVQCETKKRTSADLNLSSYKITIDIKSLNLKSGERSSIFRGEIDLPHRLEDTQCTFQVEEVYSERLMFLNLDSCTLYLTCMLVNIDSGESYQLHDPSRTPEARNPDNDEDYDPKLNRSLDIEIDGMDPDLGQEVDRIVLEYGENDEDAPWVFEISPQDKKMSDYAWIQITFNLKIPKEVLHKEDVEQCKHLQNRMTLKNVEICLNYLDNDSLSWDNTTLGEMTKDVFHSALYTQIVTKTRKNLYSLGARHKKCTKTAI